MRIEQFYVGGLGHQSYLVTDEAAGVAAVIDPRRDCDIYLDAAERAGVRVTHVFETHVHNDYVTGALELRDRVGATIVTARSAGALYDHVGVAEGERVAVGALRFVALETPGHTPSHLSYALYEADMPEPFAVFTGGSLLSGSAGRTDLVSPGMTLTLTRDQFRSLRRLLGEMPAATVVYPTHGAGSFCGATNAATAERSSTIARERAVNPVASATDEAEFVRAQLAGYGLYPRYYVHMRDINLAGPRVLGQFTDVPALAPAAVQARQRDGMPLIDGRDRVAFAHEHVPGSLNIELDESFSTYVGWLLPINAELILQIADAADRREAVTQLLRIGYERTRGYLDGGIAAWTVAGLPVAAFDAVDVDELHRRWRRHQLAVLDVRDDQEWAAGHIPDAQHIHVGDLPRHLNALPRDLPVATICASGYRASIAASLVAATGRPTVAVRGGVTDWIARGYDHVAEAAGGQDEHGHV